MLNNEHCVFIISYKRANNNPTYDEILKNGYKNIYVVVADDDEQIEQYKKKYKDRLILFSRKEVKKKFDICDNFEGLIGSVFPRNAINDIAKKLGVKYYLVLDDDYTHFSYRRVFGNKLRGFRVKNLGSIILACFLYLEKATKIDCFAFCQDGDFIGGASSFESIGGKRKIMNAFFFKTINNDVKYIGRLNEDVNTYLYYGHKGKLFFTINDVSVHQKATQNNAGGLSEVYLDSGTYVKSFYSVIISPNSVKINTIGTKDLRIHHKINWNKACPKLIREEHKK